MPKRVISAAVVLALSVLALPASTSFADCTVSTSSCNTATATSVALTAGSLSMTGDAPSNFASTALTGVNEQITTALGAGTVTDARGLSTTSGWHVSLLATQFACTASTGQCPVGGDSFPTGSLLLGNTSGAAACAAGSTCRGSVTVPSLTASGTAIDTGSALTQFTAASGAGNGKWSITPGTAACTIGVCSGSLVLTVPGDAYAATYTSTVTVTLNTGP